MGKGINKDLKAADTYAEGPIAQYPVVLCADADPRIVYAMNKSTGFWPPHHPTVFRSADAGETWAATLFMDPRFAGTYNLAPNYQSAVCGTSYQEGVEWAAICPSDPNVLVRVGAGTCFVTNNGGKDWFNGHTALAPGQTGPPTPRSTFNCTGLVVTTTWNYYVDPFMHARHYICYTDIGFVISADAARTWRWFDDEGGIDICRDHLMVDGFARFFTTQKGFPRQDLMDDRRTGDSVTLHPYPVAHAGQIARRLDGEAELPGDLRGDLSLQV
ncbi:MAG: hypothetical protein ABIF71_03960 [Planctomycetota bacterium]